jgi:hypothetical protein
MGGERWQLTMALAMVLAMALTAAPTWGQAVGAAPGEVQWQAGGFGGWFTGGTIVSNAVVNGEPVRATTDEGWLFGVRVGADQEYLGAEATIAGVFQDLNLEAAPEAGLRGGDASWLLASLNALVYPAGNALADGRIKPFVTVGPGLAYLDSDFREADNETMFAWNAGLGVKFLLGEDGNPILRIDYRWYQMMGTGELKSNMWRQELSVGLGIRF